MGHANLNQILRRVTVVVTLDRKLMVSDKEISERIFNKVFEVSHPGNPAHNSI